jgi:hypothetical protein
MESLYLHKEMFRNENENEWKNFAREKMRLVADEKKIFHRK